MQFLISLSTWRSSLERWSLATSLSSLSLPYSQPVSSAHAPSQVQLTLFTISTSIKILENCLSQWRSGIYLNDILNCGHIFWTNVSNIASFVSYKCLKEFYLRGILNDKHWTIRFRWNIQRSITKSPHWQVFLKNYAVKTAWSDPINADLQAPVQYPKSISISMHEYKNI